MKIVDADGHLIEGAGFVSQALERWPDKVQLSIDDDVPLLEIEGRRYPKVSGTAVGVPVQASLVDAEDADPWTVPGTLADADREGIDTMILYPSLGLGAHAFDDLAFTREFSLALNKYMADWCSQSEGRLVGAAVVPLEDLQHAIEIMGEAKELGLRVASIPPAMKTRNLDHPELVRFYAAAVDMDMPIGIHGAPGLYLPPIGVDRFTNYIQGHCISFPFDQMTAMTSIVAGGVLERHPKLRVAFLEAGVGWVPYFLERLHEHYEKRGSWVEGGWKRDPWEYLHRGQMYWTCEAEEKILPAVLEIIGDDYVMYASDYPHWDSDFPDSARSLRERTDISDEARAKIFAGNAQRFYGLPR